MNVLSAWWLPVLLAAGALLALAASVDAAHSFSPPASAGPDTFGYTMDSTIAYSWDDVSATGTELVFEGLGKSGVFGPVMLPADFDFVFYGEEKDRFWVSSNGFITFTDPGTDFNCCSTNQHLPNSANYAVRDFVAPLGGFLSYDDGDQGCGEVHVGEAGSPRRLIVQWDAVCYQKQAPLGGTFQVKLFDVTNHVEVHYASLDGCGTSCGRDYVGGIENKAQDDGIHAFSFVDPFGGKGAFALRYAYPNQAPEGKDDGDGDGDGDVEDSAFIIGKETDFVLLDVLANDEDVDGDDLSVASVTSPSDNGYATLTVEADGRVRFDLQNSLPAVAALGHGDRLTETFRYTPNDGLVDGSTATVTVRIDGIDHVPTVHRHGTLETVEAHPGASAVTLALTHLDASDPDDPDDTVTFRLASLPTGTLRVDGAPAAVGDTFTRADIRNGLLTYMPTADDPGDWPQDLFTFTAYDPDNEAELAYAGGAAQQLLIKITPWDDPPVPSFDFVSGRLYEGIGVWFTDTSASGDGPLGPFVWSFGDGGQATGAEVVHAFDRAGTYTVRLDVTEGAQTRSVEQTVEVLPYDAPVPDFLVSDIRPVVGQEVVFTDTTVAGAVPLASRRWDFSGPSLSVGNEAEVVVRFPTPGTYRATLTVTDELGQAYTSFHDVMVGPADGSEGGATVVPEGTYRRPQADAGADQVVLPGSVVRLRGASAPDLPGTGFTWTQVDGPRVPLHEAGTASPRVEVPWMEHPTEVLFQLIVEQEGMPSEPDTVRLVIDPDGKPSLPPEALPDATFSADVSATGRVVLAAASGAARYVWDFGDGTSEEGGPLWEHRYVTNGTFRVQLTVVDDLGRTEAWSQSVSIGGSETNAVHDARAAEGHPVWPWLLLGGVLLGGGAVVLLAWRRPTS